VNDVIDVIAMASKRSTVNSLVTQSADNEQLKHVDYGRQYAYSSGQNRRNGNIAPPRNIRRAL